MERNLVLLATAAALALSGLSAHAGCVDPRVMVQNAAQRMPLIVMPQAETGASATANDGHDGGHDDIVGTWQVSYTSGGSPGGDAFIQWHDDGTEFENIDFPILGGNICMGSWRQLDHHRVRRSHIGWLYTDGNLTGYFTETETDTVAHNGNSYTGNNDTKIFDLDGNMQAEFPGTADAVRLQP
jgi:hypothetical protein